MARIGGLAPASVALVSFVLIRYGLRGAFNFKTPWRALLLVGAIVAGLFSGFRATFLLALIMCGVQFFAEGLHKTKYLFIPGFRVLGGFVCRRRFSRGPADPVYPVWNLGLAGLHLFLYFFVAPALSQLPVRRGGCSHDQHVSVRLVFCETDLLCRDLRGVLPR